MNLIEPFISETMKETGISVQPRKVLWIEDLWCSRVFTRQDEQDLDAMRRGQRRHSKPRENADIIH